MSSSSPDASRSHTPHPTLDSRVCAELGQRLAKFRADRKLTVDDLSSRLLLSTRQVRALEAADLSAFHNASFFMIALRKYAAFCGIARETVDAAIVDVPSDVEQVDETIEALREANAEPRDWTSLLAILGVCAVIGAGWGVFRFTRASSFLASNIAMTRAASTDTATPAAAPAAENPSAPAPAADAVPPIDPTVTAPPGEVPAAAPPSQEPGALSGQVAYGSLWSPQKAWMFLRMENDVVIERTVAAGELVQLPGKPKYLAIGTSDAELTIGITPVDVSRFVQKGTLRMGVAEFGIAEQSVLGGTVPDPAEPAQR